MLLGVIARVDGRGLGNQTWEVARHLEPARILVVRAPGSEAQGFVPDLGRFPGATVGTINEHNWTLPEDEVRDWLSGLDVVYSAETLYDWRLADWARDANCSTVVHVNPEFYMHHRKVLAEPTEWWAPTDWRIGHLPAGTRVVEMPVPTDRFGPPADGISVLHVGGRAATGDRNGTDLVLQASTLAPEIPFTVATQTPIRRPREVRLIEHTENYWDLYAGHSILLLPRRYGGLCLPTIEACGAGMVPVMTDTVPNRSWPIVPLRVDRVTEVHLPAGRIDSHATTAEHIAEALRPVVDNLDEHRTQVAEWTQEHSWEALAPSWLEHLDRAAHAKPHRSPSVTVVVPFTPGSCPYRDRNWAWVKARYERLHPTWKIVEAHGGADWSKGQALAPVMAKVRTDVVIVADADCILPAADLAHAVGRVAAGAPWVVPHNFVRRLSQIETEQAVGSDTEPNLAPLRRRRRDGEYYTGIAGGGVVVLTPKAWRTAPIDPRFVGWGYEDVSFGCALDTLVGEHTRLGADLLHLWHPPQENHRHPTDESEHLYQHYLQANGMPRRMAALVAGEEAGPAEPVHPVTFKASFRVLALPGDRRIRFRDGQVTVTDPDLIDLFRRRPDIEEVA